MQECVRIVVVGNAGVGKTSLITSLVQDFQERVPPKVPPVLLPSSKESNNLRTEIIDTSSKPADAYKVDDEIKRADFICIVYDLSREDTKDSIEEFWLPKIRKLRQGRRPISMALVGAKRDTRDEIDAPGEKEERERDMRERMNKYEEIEYTLECSAKHPESREDIDLLFWYAQNNVLYPKQPLCNSSLELTPAFLATLDCIFFQLDSDKDGFLDDEDIKTLQWVCFNVQYTDQEVLDIKDSLKAAQEEEGIDGPEALIDGKVTKSGFRILFELMLERGKTETVWKIIRTFGFDNKLAVRDDACIPDPPPKVPEQRLEFGKPIRDYLEDVFFAYSTKGLMSKSQFETLSSLIPSFVDYNTPFTEEDKVYTSGHTNPLAAIGFPYCAPVTWKGETDWEMNFDTFYSAWAFALLIDYKTALRQLHYFGVNIKADKTCVLTTNDARSRSTLRAFVFGSKNVGKSTFLASLTGSSTTNINLQGRKCVSSKTEGGAPRLRAIRQINLPASSIARGDGFSESVRNHLLVLEELSQEEQFVVVDDIKRECDVALFFYDQSNAATFHALMPLFKKFCLKKIPCVVVACKSDLPADPSLGQKPVAALRQYGLAPVLHSNLGKQIERLPVLAVEHAILCKSPLHPSPGLIHYLKRATTLLVGFTLTYVSYVAVRHYWRSGSFQSLTWRHFYPVFSLPWGATAAPSRARRLYY
eukprot:TRINITY_DN4395_c0_g1_i3.p1 TRINITY_DN4395_c0_g1~~TRINITY_DN4395_c0_g1_i3.p1  ORF type:complete len:713 (-),score=115.57 TRINITY_DN4395_c0_g1_i3:134-2239(-)